MQSVLMELVLSTVGDLRAWAFMLSGALAVGWNFPHKFVMMRVMYGRNIVQVYQKLAQDGSQMLGIDASAALLILAILLVVRLVIGGIAGWGAWALGGAVARRLGQRTQLASS
jgi:hypothetical protein